MEEASVSVTCYFVGKDDAPRSTFAGPDTDRVGARRAPVVTLAELAALGNGAPVSEPSPGWSADRMRKLGWLLPT